MIEHRIVLATPNAASRGVIVGRSSACFLPKPANSSGRLPTHDRPPTSAIIEVLTPIWQRVLQRSTVGVDDDFFDLGGNGALAGRLFAEVAQACGLSLRPTTICQAPTIGALADLLLDTLQARTLTPLTLLKPGTEKPLVFITHGIAGSVIDSVPLARRLQLSQPIYGMQAKGTDDGEAPFERIEDMAQCYLDAMKALQPDGPYFLIGYSLGGLVMLEMAQRLSANGDKVSLLAMLDSYPHSRYLSAGQRVSLFMRRAARLGKLPKGEAISRVIRQAGRKSPSPIGEPVTADVLRSVESANRALSRYRPRFYRGKIEFIGAETATNFPENPKAIWAKLASDFEYATVPGDHLGMVTTHVDSLALALSRRLKAALRQECALSDTHDLSFRGGAESR